MTVRHAVATSWLALGLTVAALHSAFAQELLVFPRQTGTDYQPLREACLNPALWPTGWERMTMFGNSVQFFGAWTNDAEVAQCFANLRNAGKKLVVELGSLKPQCQTAQACWDSAYPTLARLASLAPPDAYLAIDEPISTGHLNYPNQIADFGYAVAQTVEFIRIARTFAPGLKIILHEAYPNLSAYTVAQFFAQVHYGAISTTGMGVQYADVDWDWNDGRGNLWEISQLKDYVHGIGLGFSLLFWNAQPHARSWEDGLMHEGFMVHNFGLRPDLYAVLDFVQQPDWTLAEWDAGTFTRSVRNFANTFLPTASSSHGLRVNEVLYPGQTRVSVDGRFALVYQWDGNLVLYYGSTALWHTATYGTSPGGVAMQSDGSLVVYDASGVPRWASNTAGYGGAFLLVQSDGNLVLYQDATPRWASNTAWY